MEREVAKVALVLKQLGLETSARKYQSRIKIQKAMYLAQAAGFRTGYNFGWYVRGPYSPRLADTYFALKDYEMEDLSERYALSDDVQSSINNIKLAVDAFQRTNSGKKINDDAKIYELLASWHFLRNRSNYSLDDAKARMEQDKPNLADFVNDAEESLVEVGLLTKKEA